MWHMLLSRDFKIAGVFAGSVYLGPAVSGAMRAYLIRPVRILLPLLMQFAGFPSYHLTHPYNENSMHICRSAGGISFFKQLTFSTKSVVRVT